MSRFERPRASSAATSTSRSLRPAGRSRRVRGTGGPPRPARHWTASPSSRPARTSRRNSLGGFVGGERGAVRPRLGHGLVGVGGGQDARRGRQRLAGDAAVVAGAVHPLVVLRRQGADAPQRLGTRQDAVRVIGVQADLLPLALRQRALPYPRSRRRRRRGRCRAAGRLGAAQSRPRQPGRSAAPRRPPARPRRRMAEHVR